MSLIDIDEASRQLGVSKSTMYKRVMTKSVPYIKLGGRVFFDPARLDSWIREHAVEPLLAAK